MILQTDKRLRKEINQYGCYLMSILFLANKHGRIILSTDIIENVADKLIEFGYMNKNCFILSAENIFKSLGLKVRYHDKHDPITYMCKYNEIEILCLNVGSGSRHFVVGDGMGHIAYDPMGTSKVNFVESKRVFKLL